MARKSKQLAIDYYKGRWGGARKGAGRKKSPHSGVPHLRRARLASRFPVHVTMRLVRDRKLVSLRRMQGPAKRALYAASGRFGMRVVHFCLQKDHLHLLVEAKSTEALSRGMQGLSIRLAKSINRYLHRTGPVLADRYHARILKTPLEVKRALCYVLLNVRKHKPSDQRKLPADWCDPCSTGPMFDGWKRRPHNWTVRAPPAHPRSWLLSVGWRRHGLLRTDEAPADADNRP